MQSWEIKKEPWGEEKGLQNANIYIENDFTMEE